MSDEKTFSLHIFTLNAGGGHYATLKALNAIAQQQKRPWQITVTDIGQLTDLLDPYKKLFGVNANDVYNDMLSMDWTWFHPVSMFLDKFLISLLYPQAVKVGEQHWRQQPAIDLVISLIPLHNRAIWESLQRVKPGTPMVTILTDFADCPPHFWLEPETKSYFICGTEQATNQARTLGVLEEYIIPTSGLIVHPRFYQPISCDRRTERQRLGLDPDRITAIVSFGAKGCATMLNIARDLEQISDRVQVIFLCGANQKLAQALQERPTQLKQHIQGFTEDVPYFMSLADFLIGKPGSISISEAIVMNLPVIVDRNFSTLLNEKYNADWILEKQVGITVKNFHLIVSAIAALLTPENWQRYKENVTAMQNRAVFEISEIFQSILDS
jgi:Glycosyltransferase family 28 C-terminal domain/Monogalactosyldiacylglycerol (MGDG) synthase